jgi:hypothetical protein
MTPKTRSHERPDGERHTTRGQTKSDTEVTSHREVARLVREADRFALQLPMVGRVPFPRPDQLAFYGALAGLVAVELIDWPVAVAIGVGHALVSGHPDQKSSEDTS